MSRLIPVFIMIACVASLAACKEDDSLDEAADRARLTEEMPVGRAACGISRARCPVALEQRSADVDRINQQRHRHEMDKIPR